MSIFSILIFSDLAYAQAVKDYTLLAPIPIDGTITNKLTADEMFSKYIPGIFNLIIGLVAVLAVVRIIWGGILYISSDAIQSKSDGKRYIIESIWGLVLISVSWLILYTINPKLVKIDLSITPTQVPSTTVSVAAGCTNCVTMAGFQNIGILGNVSRSINSDTYGKLASLDSSMGAAGLKGTITSGFESGHQNSCHGSATCVDLDLNVTGETPANILKTANLITQAGLTPKFEVETPERKTAIVNTACGSDAACKTSLSANIMVLPPINGVRQISGEHFSVYNCSADPGSCTTFK